MNTWNRITSHARSHQLLETREEAVSVVQQIVSGVKTHFEQFHFHKFNDVSKFRLQHYNRYLVVGHVNTLRSEEWLVCRYDMNSGSPLDKAIQCFEAVQGGTSRLELHTRSQKKGIKTLSFQRQLPIATRKFH